MYNEVSVLGITITAAPAGAVAFTGFNTMLWVWVAMCSMVIGLLVLRWSAVIGVERSAPPQPRRSVPERSDDGSGCDARYED